MEISNPRLSKWMSRVWLNKCACYITWDHLVSSSWKELWANSIFVKTPVTKCTLTFTPHRRVFQQSWIFKQFDQEPIFTKKPLTKCTLRLNTTNNSFSVQCCEKLKFYSAFLWLLKWCHFLFQIYHALILYIPHSSAMWRFMQWVFSVLPKTPLVTLTKNLKILPMLPLKHSVTTQSERAKKVLSVLPLFELKPESWW